MKTAGGRGAVSDKIPASVALSLGLHAAGLAAFMLVLHAAPKSAPRMVESVDVLIAMPRKPRMSALEFMKLAIPKPKAARAAVRARLARRVRPAEPAPMPDLTTRHGASAERYRRTAERYRQAAERGEAGAQFSLAGLYYIGHGVEQDYGAAMAWYRKAAAHGDAVAQTNLGTMYYSGRGVPVDYDAAIAWYRKAAQLAYPPAQSILGTMYEEGHGVARNEAEALSWYRKAAAQDDASAEYKLGLAYENGYDGLAKDEGQAMTWYQKAADQEYDAVRPNRQPGDLWDRACAERERRKALRR
ncbi:MAG: tetratricopeptide repeat protein [Elusimicrobiota bacterium]